VKHAGASRSSRGRRADIVLVERGLAQSRSAARAAIEAGRVRANGVEIEKPAQLVLENATFEYAPAHPYVARSALKLLAALDRFALSPRGFVGLDLGASTGGFTEVLLLRGATKIYALDVGHGQLHSRLLSDPRVVSLEGRNARALSLRDVAEPPEFVTADVSFISLKLALPQALSLAKPGAWMVALIKPQFEAGRAKLGKGGIVRDESDRQAACNAVRAWLSNEQGWRVDDIIESPIAGGDGNREYLIAAHKP